MNSFQRPVRVRFAPSPTGPLHIGGVRTALYNYLFARKHGGTFILRIEDTDQSRFVPGAEEYIQEALQWLGLLPDEGPTQGGPHAPYRQSERTHLYRQFAEKLLDSGHAYYAFDTEEELEDMRLRLQKSGQKAGAYNSITRYSMKNSLTLSRDEVQARIRNGEPYVIRIKIPRNEEVRVNDLIRGTIVVNSSTLDDKVLFKSDGMPTYHLANVADDYLMQITHVIRGEEWLPSAPLHVLLYKYLGLEEVMPQFAHLPLILKPEGNGKLSKRDGDRLGFPVFPLQWRDPESGEISAGYRESGWLPEAVINFLALLGWHPTEGKELFSLSELIDLFDLSRISKSGAKFDLEKARWINRQYVQALPPEVLGRELCRQAVNHGINADPQYCHRVASLVKERLTLLSDLWKESHFFFSRPGPPDAQWLQGRWNPETAALLDACIDRLSALELFESHQIEDTISQILREKSLKPAVLLPLLRVLLTGTMTGPSVADSMALLGKEETLHRLRTYRLWNIPV
ncbi:MAG: glutamate--tRNA ligase [Flavobacteriales bacterium]|nr:glutamate--tRNA ligase [Flavobacteriales bacterium]MCX7768745.1 glutamate--tRNA ligase [Flavobacteriales bacterium]MDW8409904.1 glutamate--tRNA ligase [Flavobacteriales bacterium]